MKIVALLGKAGSGKGEVARWLVQKGFYEMALSDPIKLFCGWVFGWDESMLFGPSQGKNSADSEGLSIRKTLQELGSFVRDRKADGYVQCLAHRISTIMRIGNPLADSFPLPHGVFSDRYIRYSEFSGIVVSDVRFKNEIDFIKDIGGKVYRVSRASAPLEIMGCPKHPSELEQESIQDDYLDGVIENNFATTLELECYLLNFFDKLICS